MKARILDPRDLFPDEQVMWKTAEDQPLVPAWYVIDLMFKLQGLRDELEQVMERLSEEKEKFVKS
jgi:hypothetical protein